MVLQLFFFSSIRCGVRYEVQLHVLQKVETFIINCQCLQQFLFLDLLVVQKTKTIETMDCVLGSVFFCVSLGSYSGNISVCTVNFYDSLE